MATVWISELPRFNVMQRLKSWASQLWEDHAAAMVPAPVRPLVLELKPVKPGRVLTIAPHMDDEAIGAGGLLALHRQAGSTLGLVFASDHEGGTPSSMSLSKSSRLDEAKRVAARLGAKYFRALPNAGGRLGLNELTLAKQFAEILTGWEPDQIICPFPADHQRDHQAVSQALAAAIEFNRWRGEVWCCEVWSTLSPNVGIDITSVIDEKRQMIKLYQAQSDDDSQLNAAIGLNRFRGQRLDVAYAETFHVCKAAEFIKLAGSHSHA